MTRAEVDAAALKAVASGSARLPKRTRLYDGGDRPQSLSILCDGGARYASKLFNPPFLRERGLPVPGWLA